MAEPSQFVRVKRYVSYTALKTTKKYKKGRKVSAAYAKRFPKLVKAVQWLQFEERQAKYDPALKHQVYKDWKIVRREKLTQYEHIMNLAKASNRSIRDTFARHQVYSRIWENNRGDIRVTVNGSLDGRRIKEVLHIGFLKSMWSHKHNGYEQFKDYLVTKVLDSLRRRGLRLSNPKEARERLQDLRKKRKVVESNLEVVPDWMREKEMETFKSLTKLIRQQRRAHQIQGVSIRIEKLIP